MHSLSSPPPQICALVEIWLQFNPETIDSIRKNFRELILFEVSPGLHEKLGQAISSVMAGVDSLIFEENRGNGVKNNRHKGEERIILNDILI